MYVCKLYLLRSNHHQYFFNCPRDHHQGNLQEHVGDDKHMLHSCIC